MLVAVGTTVGVFTGVCVAVATGILVSVAVGLVSVGFAWADPGRVLSRWCIRPRQVLAPTVHHPSLEAQ